MRCFSCGEHLEGTPEVCPRCLTNLTRPYFRRHMKITVVYTIVAITAIAVFCLVVLLWHESQLQQLAGQ
jgi:predicted amidophosphoribosyltransferase